VGKRKGKFPPNSLKGQRPPSVLGKRNFHLPVQKKEKIYCMGGWIETEKSRLCKRKITGLRDASSLGNAERGGGKKIKSWGCRRKWSTCPEKGGVGSELARNRFGSGGINPGKEDLTLVSGISKGGGEQFDVDQRQTAEIAIQEFIWTA